MKGKLAENFNIFLANRNKLEQYGFSKGHLLLDKVSYSLELQSESKNISVDIFDLRKYLVSQQTKSVKKPVPKDFLFEISLLLVSKLRIDLLLPDQRSLKRLEEGFEAIFLMKEVLKEIRK